MAAADTIMTSRLPCPASSGGSSGHAKMPATLKFLVSNESGEEEGGLKDTANFIRVQELFSVIMSVCSDGEGYDVVSLTGTDADRIEKTRCYVMAMSCPQVYSDVECSRNVAAVLLTGPLRASIERDHLVYLRNYYNKNHSHLLMPASGTVRVQGMEENVSSAVSKIQTIIEMVEQGTPVDVTRARSREMEPGSSPYYKPVHVECMKITDHNGDGFGERRCGNGNMELGKSGKFLSLLPRDPSDPNMEKRIEYFVKLDFPKEIVRSILISLGPHASENEVMDRLMKVAPGGQAVNKSLNDRRRGSPPRGDAGGSQIDEHEQQQQQIQQKQQMQRKIPLDPSKLRPVVIDGSNVAMRHGSGQVFSCRGIQLAVDFFKERGHEKITVFVPEWRKESSRPETPITEQHLLDKLEKEKHLVYTPSRRLNNGRRIVCYDDRYIVRLANEEGGVIVSNDQFRDLMQENPEWKKVIEQRLLQFAFVSDLFMPPDDPLGKSGPTLDQFMTKDQRDMAPGSRKASSSERAAGSSSKPICPYLGNCTFGKKCRFYHPDREPQQQQQQQQPPVQKQEPSLTVNSSGYRTPTMASSRSATPSPGPDGRAHGGRSYSAAKLDRRVGHASSHSSSHSSTDDLYHEKSYSGGGGGCSGAGLDITTPTSTGIDMSKLSEELERTSLHRSPNRKPNYSFDHGIAFHQSTNRVVSSPVFSETSPASIEPARQQNRTFPLAHLPQREGRGPNVTGDHSYFLNAYVSSGAVPDHLTRHQYQHEQAHHLPPDNLQEPSRRVMPRDPRSPPQFLTSPSPSPYPQRLAPPPAHPNSTAHAIPLLPPSSRHTTPGYYADVATDSSSSRRSGHQYQVQPGPLSQHVSSASSMPGYSVMARDPHAHHVNATPPIPYSNQSTASLQGLQRLPQSSQTPSQFHPTQQKYIQSTAGSVPHAAAQVYSMNHGFQREGDSSGGRQELYRAAVSMLPGCEQRIQFVMDQHLELSSERNLGLLLQYVRQDYGY